MPLPALAALLLPSLIGAGGSIAGNLLSRGSRNSSGYNSLGGLGYLQTPGGGNISQLPSMNPQHQQLANQSISQIFSNLQNRPSFEPIAARAREQFNTQTVPSIAARFSSMGTGGNLRSSAFQHALASGASDLESQLAAQGSMFGQQQQQIDQNLLLNLLRLSQPENIYEPRQSGLLESLAPGLGALLGGLGSGFGQSMGYNYFNPQQ